MKLLRLLTLFALASPAVAQPDRVARVDRYGHPLPAGARERLGSLAFRQSGSSVSELRLSPKGDLLIARGTYTPTLTLWDPAQGRRLGTLVGAGRESWDVTAFSPDGRLLVGAGEDDGSVEVWDLTTRKRIHLLTQRKKSGVTGVFFTKPRELLVTTFDELRWWDLTTGTALRMVVAECLLHSPRLSPDGAWLAVTDTDGRIQLLDTVRGDIARTIQSHGGTIHDLAFAPSGKQIAVVGRTKGRSASTRPPSYKQAIRSLNAGRALRVFDVETGKRRWSQPVVTYRVDYAPDGKHLITVENFKTLQVWDSEGNKTARVSLGGHSNALAVSAAKKLLVVSPGSTLGTLTWPLTATQTVRRAKGHASFSALAVTPDGKRLVSSGGGELRAWDLSDGALLRKQALARSRDVAISPDGTWLVVEQASTIALRGKQGKPGAIVVLDAKTWKERARFKKPGWLHCDLRFSPDGKLLVAGGRDRVRRIDVATWKELKPFPGGNWALAFSRPHGDTLAVGGGKTLALWDLPTGRKERELKHPQVFGLAFSPNGKTLAFSSLSPRAIKLLDVASGKTLHDLSALFRINASPEPVFSPDGKTLVFGFSDEAEQISLVDVARGKVRQVLKAPGEGYAVAVAFTPDGKTLVSGHRGGTILLWSLAGTPAPRAKGVESPFRD